MEQIKITIDYNGKLLITNNDEYEYPTSQQLEKILCAVKQAKEKLLNIQIQELQDSKKDISMNDNTLSHVSELGFTNNAKLFFDGSNLMLVKPDGTRVKLG